MAGWFSKIPKRTSTGCLSIGTDRLLIVFLSHCFPFPCKPRGKCLSGTGFSYHLSHERKISSTYKVLGDLFYELISRGTVKRHCYKVIFSPMKYFFPNFAVISCHWRNYGWLMLSAVRALVEQQPIEEDYTKFEYVLFSRLEFVKF